MISVYLLSGLPHDGCPCCHDTHLVPAAHNVSTLGGSLVVPSQSGILNKSDHEKDASFKQFETLSPGLQNVIHHRLPEPALLFLLVPHFCCPRQYHTISTLKKIFFDDEVRMAVYSLPEQSPSWGIKDFVLVRSVGWILWMLHSFYETFGERTEMRKNGMWLRMYDAL